MGVGLRSTSYNSAKFAEFAFGGLGVGVYDTSDNSAKFYEFSAFGGVGVGVESTLWQKTSTHKLLNKLSVGLESTNTLVDI